MSKSHYIKLALEITADDMDGTPYQSAEIFLELIDNAIKDLIPDVFSLVVTDFGEI